MRKTLLMFAAVMSLLFSGMQAAPLQPLKLPDNGRIGPFAVRGDIPQYNAFRQPTAVRKMSSSAPFLTAAPLQPLYGAMRYSASWGDDEQPIGMYIVPVEGSTPKSFTALSINDQLQSNGGGVAIGDKYYCVNYYVVPMVNYVYIYLNTFETDKWTKISEKSLNNYSSIATDMTYDPSTGKVYGCFLTDDDSGTTFSELDIETGETRLIRALPSAWNACGATADGKIYAITADGDLVRCDPNDGQTYKIGYTGLVPYYASSGTIDASTGTFYYIHVPSSGASALYTIDLSTAKATKVYSMPSSESFAGLFVPVPPAGDKAPGSLENVTFSFDKTSLSGKITFDAPSALYDGTEATGELTYKLDVDGVEFATGKTAFGAKDVEINITLPDNKLYVFDLSVSNEVGHGPVERVEKFIGKDTPRAATQVKVSRSGSTMSVSWWAPRACVNGGYFDTKELSYTVKRMPDNVTVASNTTATSFSETLEEPEHYTAYSYVVTVSHLGVDSEPAESNIIYLGPIWPPYSEDFETDPLDKFIIIDNNGDGRRWERVDMGYQDNIFMRIGYSYAEDNMTDDYLVLPPLHFEAGMNYEFSMIARGDYLYNDDNPYVEKGEVVLGDAPTVEALTRVIIEPTEFRDPYWRKLSGRFNIDRTGTYYIAIHGISGPVSLRWQIDDIAVAEGLNSLAPAAPTDVVITPAADKSLSAEISFKAPARDLADNTITSLDRIEVWRDDQLIKTFTAPTPGTALTMTDNDGVANGLHAYRFVPYNANGMGLEAKVSAYVGAKAPAQPTGLNVIETEPGKIKATWDEVTLDVDGDPLPKSSITYVLLMDDEYGNSVVLAENLTANELTADVCAPTANQRFATFGVVAVTGGGSSQTSETLRVAIGAAEKAPYIDSCPNGQFSHPYNVVSDSSCGFAALEIGGELADSASIFEDADNNGGYLAFVGYLNYIWATYTTGKIDMSELSTPVLTFYRWIFPESQNQVKFTLIDYATKERTVVCSYTDGDSQTAGWVREVVDLSAFKGKTVQLEIRVDLIQYSMTAFDRIAITDYMPVDMGVVSFSVPNPVEAGQPNKITTRVQNLGSRIADGFSVELRRNGSVVQTKNLSTEVEPNALCTVNFEEVPDMMQPDELTYSVRVVKEGDADTSNNLSKEVTVGVKRAKYPIVNTLYAQAGANDDVVLTWYKPNSWDWVNDPVIEDFEDYESYTTDDMGDWLSLDLDGGISGGIEGLELPVELQAIPWFIFDTLDLGSQYPPFSGTKHACSMYLFNLVDQSDDWLISPKLPGVAQDISLYARAYQAAFPETFEILYSTTDTDPNSFVSVEVVRNIPAEWMRYEFSLPEGAKYFAIRCISRAQYMLWVDYVSFLPLTEPQPLHFVGYKMWRDGKLLTNDILTDTRFVDPGAANGNHRYHVTTVYEEGESRKSNEAYVGMAEIGLETLFAAGDNATIEVDGREIVVSGAEGADVVVAIADGRVAATAVGDVRIAVAPGVYVVKAGRTIAKVVVK